MECKVSCTTSAVTLKAGRDGSVSTLNDTDTCNYCFSPVAVQLIKHRPVPGRASSGARPGIVRCLTSAGNFQIYLNKSSDAREIMAIFYVNVYIISRENSCKIFYNASRAPFDIVRCPVGHKPMFSYTDSGRRPYDMWPRKIKFLKIVRCPGDYQIRRWCAHRWNRTMSVLVTIALMQIYRTSF